MKTVTVRPPLQFPSHNVVVDIEFHRNGAKRLRARAVRHALRKWGFVLLRAARGITAPLKAYWQRQTLYRDLGALDARELRDIGISRADFDAIVSGEFTRDPSRRGREAAQATNRGTVDPELNWLRRPRPGVRASV